MKVLLDTHAWLWMMFEPQRIGSETRRLVADPSNAFYLSVASGWELAVKHAAGRLILPEPPLSYIRSRTRVDGISILAVSLEHVCKAAALPRHHADPFDRLLVAQAELEQLVLLTHEHHIPAYGIKTLDPVQ